MVTYHAGQKAYYDTFAGMVPVKVTKVNRNSSGRIVGKAHDVEFTVTETHGPYLKGEKLSSPGHRVVPYSHKKYGVYYCVINTNFKWDMEKLK